MPTAVSRTSVLRWVYGVTAGLLGSLRPSRRSRSAHLRIHITAVTSVLYRGTRQGAPDAGRQGQRGIDADHRRGVDPPLDVLEQHVVTEVRVPAGLVRRSSLHRGRLVLQEPQVGDEQGQLERRQGVHQLPRLVTTTAEKLVEHCVYTLTHPSAAHLVARSRDWKGISSLDFEYGVPKTFARFKRGLWAGKQAHTKRKASRRSKRAKYARPSKFPAKASIVLTRPAVMLELTDDELRAHIRDQRRRSFLESYYEALSQFVTGVRDVGATGPGNLGAHARRGLPPTPRDC